MDNTFINLNEIDAEPIEINLGGANSKPTVNFGDGIELLMNDKKRTSSSDKLNVDIGDLDNLEKELNHLSTSAPQQSDEGTKSLSGLTGDLFGLGGFSKVDDEIKLETEKINIDIEPIDSNLGSATRDSIGVTKTWDGFTKMNEVPHAPPPVNNMSDREKEEKKSYVEENGRMER